MMRYHFYHSREVCSMARWRVREIAEPERWSVRKLAAASGLAYTTVQAIWSNSAKRADLDTLDALAQVLKVQPGDLIAAEPVPPPRRRLRELRGLGKDQWQQMDSTAYLQQERDTWDG
jgi:DNA-binding Xre family transcriptional regulator